jgi:hypothetical protein
LRALPDPKRAIADAIGFDGWEGPSDPWLRLELDKSWHGLHFLLTGETWGFEAPLGPAVVGGERTEFDANHVSAIEVARIAALLEALSDEEIARRLDTWDPDAHDLYQCGDWRDAGVRSHYLGLFRELRQFYVDAARRGASIVQWN